MSPPAPDPHHGHPSFLALDRVALGAASAELTAHVAGCEACRGYVGALTSAPTASDRDLALVKDRIRQRRRWWRWRTALLGGGGLVAAAAYAVVLAVMPRARVAAPGDDADAYLGSKGLPSVSIYVKHGQRSDLWDGRRPVTAGDRLRLKVDPGPHHRVQVYSSSPPAPPDSGAPALLYAGAVAPGQGTILPDAWEVDAAPGAEQLLVVFGDRAIEPAWAAWLRGRIDPGYALLTFVLPKARAAADGAPAGP
jgi:hypothetical protein